MFKILVVSDEQPAQGMLVQLLNSKGFTTLEASDGEEALSLARSEHPDLIITDVLMPTMDGYEFVRQMRADASISQTRVIIIAGHYLGREARALAEACGIDYVIYEPCEKDEILRIVDAALQDKSPDKASPILNRSESEYGHVQSLMDKLPDDASELSALNHKLSALVTLGKPLASERDPLNLLKKYCNVARKIIGAKWSTVVLLNEDAQSPQTLHTVGLNSSFAARMSLQSLREGIFADRVNVNRSSRLRIVDGDVQAAGLPSDFPALSSCLILRINFRNKPYALFCLVDKLGRTEFSTIDEQLAVTLVGQIEVALENAELYGEFERRAAELEEKVQLYAQVEQQRIRLDTIMANVPGIVWTNWEAPDDAAQVNFVSDFVENLLGYSVDEWLKTPTFWLTIVHPDDRQRAAQTAAAHFASGTNFSQQFRWVASDGHIVWAEVQASIIQDAAGKSIGMRGVSLDITERKQAEESQRRSQLQYESLVNSIDGIVWELDVNTFQFTFVSQQVERMLGFTPEQWIGDPEFWPNHLHPDDRLWVVDFCKKATASQVDRQFDYRMIADDGRTVWLRHIVTVDVSDPERALLRGVMVDVTERKRAEAEREIIYDIIEGVITTRNLGELLKLVHRSISKLILARNCFVALLDPSTDLMNFEFWVDVMDPPPPSEKLRKAFTNYVLRSNLPLLLNKDIRKQLYESGDVEKLGTESASWLGVPLRTPNRVIGVLVIQDYDNAKAYSSRDVEFLMTVGDQIALAIERKRGESENLKLLHDVGERVKELTALRSTAHSLQSENKTTAELLREISGHLRAAYRFPENTAVRIRVGDVAYQTDNFLSTEWQQRTDFSMTHGDQCSIEVVYLEARPDEAEGPFLAEERSLLNSVAEMLKSGLESKHTDLALRESEERYREMVENARDMIFTHDLKGNYTSINKAGEVITGYTHEDSLKMNLEETLAPESRGKVLEMIERKLAGEELTNYELELVAKDGGSVTVEASTRLTYQNGIPVGVQGIARDITGRKRAAKEKAQLTVQVERQRQRLDTLIASVPGVVWEAWGEPDNALQQINFVSDYVETLLGYSVEEWLGTPNFWLSIVHPDDRERAAKMAAEHFATGESYAQEFRWVARDGHSVCVEAQTSVVLDAKGKSVGLRGVNIDITERKQAEDALRSSEERLRQSQKLEAIGQLAGGIAHDFNNLLTVITGYSDLALRRLEKDNPSCSCIEEIKKAGDRAASLTRQLLAFSRKQVLQPKVLNLNAIVTDVDKLLRRLIGEDVELLVSLEPTLGQVKADPGQIEQIILNLAVNARDAMPMGGKLTIATANVDLDINDTKNHIEILPGHYVMLEMSDTGCGMDAETQPRIFEPFFTTKDLGKGTGLGLATVYGIVKQSGGDIWVDSEPGKGTTFKIYLPYVNEFLVTDEKEYVKSVLSGGSETILLAEDEDQVRRMIRRVLDMNGYRVLDAANGKEALSLFKAHEGQIDLVLTDAVMPQMSGRELAENLKGLSPDIKVLFMSGYTVDAFVQLGLLNQTISFLEKPFKPDDLSRKVREVLDAPSRKLVALSD